MTPRPPRIPKYRKHSSSQARVTLNGKDYLLGTYGSAASKDEYNRVVAEWLERERQAPPKPGTSPDPLTVNELILAYWRHAEQYYGFVNCPGERGDEACLRDALRVVKPLYGPTFAKDFGPLALKACRRKMVEKGWSRTYTNAQVDRVRRMFRWAAEEELVPGSVHQDLLAVAGLRAGKSEARETKKVRPVPDELIRAALAHMPPMIQAMAQLQRLSGCRPDEVCRVRPLDIDMRNGDCWIYRPGSDEGQHGAHKTAHHGHDRMIFFGPRAQEALRPYLGTKLDAYCFCPAEGELRRCAERRGRRRSPLTPSQKARRRKRRPRRTPGGRYTTHSYRRAIERACLKAHCAGCEHCKRRKGEQTSAWRCRLRECPVLPEVMWGPNRLRHNRATELRRHGLDLAKTVLGHSKIETTLIYAEKDIAAAMELMAKLG